MTGVQMRSGEGYSRNRSFPDVASHDLWSTLGTALLTHQPRETAVKSIHDHTQSNDSISGVSGGRTEWYSSAPKG